MSEIHYSDSFLVELAQVTSPSVEHRIFDAIDLLPHVPILGSTSLPKAIAQRYGSNVRKIPVKPFGVIYEIRDDGDFLILGLIHQRAAH